MADFLAHDDLLVALTNACPQPEESGHGGEQDVMLMLRIMSQPRPASRHHDRRLGGILGGIRSGRLPHPRHRSRPGSLRLAVSACALAAVVATGITVGLHAGTVRAARGSAVTGQIGTTAYILDRLNRSASSIVADVVYVHTSLSNGASEDEWFGPGNAVARTLIYGEHGNLLFQIGETGTRVEVVDYAERSWWAYRTVLTSVPSFMACGVPDCTITEPGTRGHDGIPATPALLRSLLDHGQYEIAAASTIHGQAALKLTPQPAADQHIATTWALWVSARYFLPLRFVASSAVSGLTESDTYYLKPTQASLTRLTVAIPGGFARRRPPLVLNGG